MGDKKRLAAGKKDLLFETSKIKDPERRKKVEEALKKAGYAIDSDKKTTDENKVGNI